MAEANSRTKKKRSRKATRAKKTRSKAGAAAAPAPAAGVCPITGLPQGAAAWAAWEEVIAGCATAGRPCVLALLDLDDFHGLAADLGPDRAQALLAETARRLGEALGEDAQTAHLGRLAGDQFGVALKDVEVEEALGRLEGVRRQVGAAAFKLGRGVRRRQVDATISVGLAGLHRDATTPRELLDQAQAALWRAKSLGGNRSGLADKDRMVLKTSYYPQPQLDQLKRLAKRLDVKESVLLREALGDLFLKYKDRPST